MIELYEKGTADIKKKKNKTKEEIEVEKQMKECTFHPNIQIEEEIIHTKFINDIHKEKEYKNLYERLKKGRMERMVKNSVNDRYNLNKDLQKFVKQSKENKNREYLEEEKSQEEFIENNTVIRINNMNKNEKNDSGKKNTSVSKGEEENYNNSLGQSSENDGEKKKEYLY